MISLVLAALSLFASLHGVPQGPGNEPAAAASSPVPDGVRPSRGEVLVDATAAPRPTDLPTRAVHGEASVGLGFGAVMQDPTAVLSPSLLLDLSERVPLHLQFTVPLRLRMADRAADQSGVLRLRDWDEVGDYLAVVHRVHYTDAFVFGDHGYVDLDLRAGALDRIELGHGSVIRGYGNSTDVDRRRAGLDMIAQVQGRLLEQPAHAELAVIAADLSGRQPLGMRAEGRWAGAGLGLSVVGDPTAPRTLTRSAADPSRVPAAARGGRMEHVGRRGVVALGTDLSYRATDDWRYGVEPYLDLVILPGLGGGGHLGVDAEIIVGRRRRLRFGAAAEATLSSDGYDPGYFDVFYLGQRWQVEPVARPRDRPPELGTERLPKWAWVQDNDLSGFGGGGTLRVAHDAGAFAEVGYRMRPGPLGHTFESRLGLDLRAVVLSALLAHRGTQHGFDAVLPGTLAQADLRVPVIRYLDVTARAGWLTALRGDVAPVDTDTRIVTGAGYFNVGVAGRIPW